MQQMYASGLLVDAAPNFIPPSQYDVLVTDICEEDLKSVCIELGQEYLSIRENKAELPLSGLFYGSNHRMFVCLPVEKRNIKLNVPFLIDTGAPYTYVTRDVFEKLGYVEKCPSSATMHVNDTAMNVNRSVGHFENVNLLGQDFFLYAKLTLSVNYTERTVHLQKT